MALIVCLTVAAVLLVAATAAPEEEMEFRQGQGLADDLDLLSKRASNLGSRLDSRNCGAFNMGKKFGGYSWLRSADSTRRRLEYFLANKWQRDGGDVPRQVGPEDLWQQGDN